MSASAGGAARRLVVFGGSGFVGAAAAEEALRRGLSVLCLSRSGAPGPGLASQPWAQRATWAKADALEPDTYRSHLAGAEAVIVSIGSPPLPFVDRAFQARARARCQMPKDARRRHVMRAAAPLRCALTRLLRAADADERRHERARGAHRQGGWRTAGALCRHFAHPCARHSRSHGDAPARRWSSSTRRCRRC
jgi:uncharacterized protein YbjT (DUF2867 family)